MQLSTSSGRAFGAGLALFLVSTAGCTTNERPAEPPPAAEDPSWAWEELSPAPTPRTEVSAVVLRGELIVVGGFTTGSAPSPAVEALNLSSGTWRALAPLPVPLHHAPAVAHGGLLHVFGGYTTHAFLPTSLHLVFDPGPGIWSMAAPLPRDRGAHGVAILGDTAYLVGGVGASGLLQEVDVFDLAAGSWSSGLELPTPRDHLAVVALGGRIHAVGGREQSLSTNTGLHEALDPAAGWSVLAPMPTPRGGIGGATAHGLLIVVGGEESGGTFEEAEAYDPETDAWTALPVMPTARHGLGVVAHRDVLYAAAGGVDPGLSVSGAVEALTRTGSEGS